MACGGGFFPADVVELRGPENAGKTLLALLLAAETGPRECAWLDMDHLLDPGFALRLRPGLTGMVLARPPSADAAPEIFCRLAGALPGLLVVDSLTGLTGPGEGARADEEGGSVEKHLAQAINACLPNLQRHGGRLVITHQSGGAAISSAYHHLRQHLERLSFQMNASLVIRLEACRPVGSGKGRGWRLTARAARLGLRLVDDRSIKIAPCWQTVDIDIMYAQGLIRTGEVFDLGVKTGSILIQEGSAFFQDQALGFGRAAAMKTMHDMALTAQIAEVIRRETLRKLLFPSQGDRAVATM